MHTLNIVRYAIHGTMCAFSLIVLGILANFVTLLRGYSWGPFNFGIFVSIVTMLLIGATHILANVNPNFFSNQIFVEIAWTGLLWIFWVSAAGSLSTFGLLGSCDLVTGEAESQCRQYQAVQAFSWLNWLMCIGLWITLLALSIMAHSKGNNRIWFQSVTDAPFWNQGTASSNDKYNMGTGATNSNFAPQNYGSQASYPSQQTYQSYPAAAQQNPNMTGASYNSQPQYPIV